MTNLSSHISFLESTDLCSDLVPELEISKQAEDRVDEGRGLVVLKEEMTNPRKTVRDGESKNALMPCARQFAHEVEKDTEGGGHFKQAMTNMSRREEGHIGCHTTEGQRRYNKRLPQRNQKRKGRTNKVKAAASIILMLGDVERIKLVKRTVGL